jgi:hypothetical protein
VFDGNKVQYIIFKICSNHFLIWHAFNKLKWKIILASGSVTCILLLSFASNRFYDSLQCNVSNFDELYQQELDSSGSGGD